MMPSLAPSPVATKAFPYKSPSTQSAAQQEAFPDPTHLAPEDALDSHYPPIKRRSAASADKSRSSHNYVPKRIGSATGLRASSPNRGRKRHVRDRSGSRRRRGAWKKLLWVKQSYPDNYTDEETFLDHLQRNPRLQPYDFWPLVADSTVIVQHVCSVAIFVSCFVAIFQERISPVSVVGWSNVATIIGWLLWDFWTRGDEENEPKRADADASATEPVNEDGSSTSSTNSLYNTSPGDQPHGLGLSIPVPSLATSSSLCRSHDASASPLNSNSSTSSPGLTQPPTEPPLYIPPPLNSSFSPRTRQRLATAKSAVLIYSALLMLSPILKSLTKSTASDSIWALSTWLMGINVFFFDYGSSSPSSSPRSRTDRARNKNTTQFPASLSTNAALMASTVLASRLPSTTHVFSLTLFSIEVFGLFPVFRRQLRWRSWSWHLFLTIVLVLGAGGAMGIVVAGKGAAIWKSALLGMIIGGFGTSLAMGGCSWWLIGLQKYKNVVIGPWDPARPVIRRRWDL